MTSLRNMWWKEPQNREWYRFITRWFLWGTFVICAWSFGYYICYRLLLGSSPGSYMRYWHEYYTKWLVSCFVVMTIISLAFLLFGLRVYKEYGASVHFSAKLITFSLVTISVLWSLSLIIVFRPHQVPNIHVALFDLSLMPGLFGFLIGIGHVAITLIHRTLPDTKDNSGGSRGYFRQYD